MDIWPGKGESEERIRVPTFTTTQYGIRARIPVVKYTNFSVALLFCTHKNLPVGIALTRCPDAADEDRPLYHCNAQSIRLVTFPPSQQVGFVVQWQTVYLAAQPPFRADTSAVRPFAPAVAYTNVTATTPFRIPDAVLNVDGLHCVDATPRTLPFGWSGDPPLTLVYETWDGWHDPFFAHEHRTPCLYVTLGMCASLTDASAGHWAVVRTGPSNDGERNELTAPRFDAVTRGEHVCPDDHIAVWPRNQRSVRVVGDLKGEYVGMDITVKFVRCLMNENGGTLVMHLAAIRKRH